MLSRREVTRIVCIALLGVGLVHAAESIKINKLDREVMVFQLMRFHAWLCVPRSCSDASTCAQIRVNHQLVVVTEDYEVSNVGKTAINDVNLCSSSDYAAAAAFTEVFAALLSLILHVPQSLFLLKVEYHCRSPLGTLRMLLCSRCVARLDLNVGKTVTLEHACQQIHTTPLIASSTFGIHAAVTAPACANIAEKEVPAPPGTVFTCRHKRSGVHFVSCWCHMF